MSDSPNTAATAPRHNEAAAALLELERAMLTIGISHRDQLVTARDEGLRADHFNSPAHSWLWRCLERLDSDLPIDEPFAVHVLADTMSSERAGADFLNSLGGTRGLFTLAAADVSPQSARQIARRVRQSGQNRSFVNALREALGEFGEGETDLTAIRSRLEDAFDSLDSSRGSRAMSIGQALLMAFDEISHSADGENRPVRTGLPELDDMLDGGFWRKQLVLIGARPGMGKTSLGLYLLKAAASVGTPTLLSSLEMSELELAYRFISAEANVPLRNLRRNELTTHHATRMNALGSRLLDESKMPLFVVAPYDTRITSIAASIRDEVRRRNVRVVGIDYVQLLSGANPGRSESRYAEVSDISKRLKLLARELDITVIALAQLNRANELRSDKRPQLSDLRDSGQLEQDADVVMLLHRPGEYDETADASTIEINVAKQRQGATGRITARWIPERATLGSSVSPAPPLSYEHDTADDAFAGQASMLPADIEDDLL